MEPAVIAAGASSCAALIALFGAIYNRNKTEEAAKEAREGNERLSERLKKMDESQQANLSLLKSDLDRMTFVVNANYSKKIEVLTEAYSKLAEIKLMVESFVVPLFAHSQTGNPQTLRDAADKFEELYKFCSMKSIYFTSAPLMTALSGVMAHLNHMLNVAHSGNSSSRLQQAAIVIEGVTPILSKIREELRLELKMDV